MTRWPNNKDFAFAIFDDTDRTTLENGPPVYGLLTDLGFRMTKSVWTMEPVGTPLVPGTTCAEPDYRRWVTRLQEQGHEIALHNVSSATSTRQQTQKGFELFRAWFGDYPSCLANHTGNREAIYWGTDRINGMHRTFYSLLMRRLARNPFQGHVEGSPLFWGDLCREHIRYVRNFVFADINTLKICPFMPYHDPLRPLVHNWFASTEGANARSFVEAVSEASQDRLEREGGACIMYTHLGKGFCTGDGIDARFKALMARLSRKNGWFVPVSVLLDHLKEAHGSHTITSRERSRLERIWLAHKLRVRGTS